MRWQTRHCGVAGWFRGAAVLPLLLMLVACAAPRKTTTSSELHLFLLAGQSNMAGRGEIDPADNLPEGRILVLGRRYHDAFRAMTD